MHKGRLEAFTDAVIAILMTIMVLELKAPNGTTLEALRPSFPILLGYLLSFVYLAIYWNNHHHMLQIAKHVNGAVLWANMHLLFWLSLIPFATAWIGGNCFATWPMAVYGFLLAASGLAYYILAQVLIRANGVHSTFAKAIGKDVKGQISLVIYVTGIACAFFAPAVSGALYIAVALIWLIPDRRLEKHAPPPES